MLKFYTWVNCQCQGKQSLKNRKNVFGRSFMFHVLIKSYISKYINLCVWNCSYILYKYYQSFWNQWINLHWRYIDWLLYD